MFNVVLTALPVLVPRATMRPVCGPPLAASVCPAAGGAAFELPVQPARNERRATGMLQGGGAPVWAALHGRKRAPGPVAMAEVVTFAEEEEEEEEEEWIRERREEEDRSFQVWLHP